MITGPQPGTTQGETQKLPVVFMHGWGYDAQFWQPLIKELQVKDPIMLEKGYMGAAPNLTLPTRPFIAVGHSAGGLWLLTQQNAWCRGLLLINSFTRFARSIDFMEGHTTSSLLRIQRGLKRDAQNEVRNFRASLGDFYSPATLNPLRLQDGLTALAQSDARNVARDLKIPLNSVAADDDPLISRAMTNACFPYARKVIFVSGGHLLPKTKPEYCARALQDLESICNDD